MKTYVECVISGVSGRFPAADSVAEFEFKLFNKIDMVTEDDSRWKPGLLNLPRRNGKIRSIDKFDAEHFDVPENEVEWVDPQDRIFLELVAEAAADAGIRPEDLAGERTGFFWGSCFQDLHKDYEDPYRVPAVCRAMAARVTHYYDIRGPTVHSDTACNSSLNAMNEAFLAMKNGLIDRAIVAGSNTCFRPLVSQRFKDLTMINKDGTCKCLDESADGYCRSEAMVVLLLERKDICKRIYAKILNSKSGSDGYKEEGITFPSMTSQRKLAEETYAEANIDPAQIGYIEAHVTGTAAGDPVEMQAMYDLICSKRKEPVLIGCVKSSIGHAEGGSGLASVAKALIVLQKKLIPPNIHFHKPNPKIIGLMTGQMVPVTEVTELPGSLIPVNSFGFGGANTHVVLEGHFEDRKFAPLSHRLVNVCGRTHESVEYLMDALEKDKSHLTPDFLSLVDSFSLWNKMNFRGYLLISGGHVIYKTIQKVKVRKTCLFFNNVCLDQESRVNFESLKPFRQLRKLVTSQGKLPEALISQVTWALTLRKLGLKFDNVIGFGTGKIACGLFKGLLEISDAIELASELSQMSDTCTRLNGETAGYFVVEVDQHGLRKYGHPKPIELTLQSSLKTLGELYLAGMSVNASLLYPEVEYPLPSSTPTLSSLIRWDHRKTYSIINYLVHNRTQKSKIWKFHFSRQNVEDAFLFDHRIDERVLFPATGYLMMAWLTYCEIVAQNLRESPVEFKDVSFNRATVLQKGSETTLCITLNEESGNFTITDGENAIVTGIIRPVKSVPKCVPIASKDSYNPETILTSNSIYREFRVRGYDYGQYFQGLSESAADGSWGRLIWRHIMPKLTQDCLNLETEDDWGRLWVRSWIAFVDAMFQLDILSAQNDSRSLFVPTRVDSIICDPEKLMANIKNSPKILDPLTINESAIIETHRDIANTIFTEGLVVKGLKTTMLKRRPQQPSLFDWKFRPFFGQEIVTKNGKKALNDYINACLAAHEQRQYHHDFDLQDKRHALLKNILCDTKESLSSDLLLGKANLSTTFLYPLMDTAVSALSLPLERENPFDVLEVNSTKDLLAPTIFDFWPSILIFDAIKLNYSILHPHPKDLSSSQTTKLKVITGSVIDSNKKQDLIIFKCCTDTDSSKFEYKPVIESAFKALRDGGFLWIIYHQEPDPLSSLSLILKSYAPNRSFLKTDEIMKFAEETGFLSIRDLAVDHNLTLRGILLRKATMRPEQLVHRVIEIGLDDYGSWFENLKLFLREENDEKDKRVWIVPKVQDEKIRATGITGLVKSLCLEEGGERLRLLIDSSTNKIDIEDPKYREIIRKDMVYNVYDADSQTWGFHQSLFYPTGKSEMPVTTACDSYLRCLKPGDLTTLTWVQDKTFDQSIVKNKRVIDVAYSALNFRDIMFASGQLDSDAIPGIHPDVVQDSILGLEFAGSDTSGKRFMGIIPYRGMATKVVTEADDDFVWPVPDNWSLSEAATVPVVYATAFYALIVRGNLSPGESVLIHSGCGGVGLAAIRIALSNGCTVYATCGSDRKREYLLQRFPQLEGKIYNSRDISFEENILRATEGTGVDAVLNSLSEDKLQASVRCLAINGRFLEIGKVDFVKNNSLLLHQMVDNKSFHGILLDALFQYSSNEKQTKKILDEKKRLRVLISEGITSGVVQPLDATVFDSDAVEDGFRFMASGKHIGKVLIKIRDENNNAIISSVKSTHFSPCKSYIVLGGLGGFGMEVVHFMAARGASHIMISSRSGVRDSYQRYCIDRLNRHGFHVFISKADITQESGCLKLIQETMEKTGKPVGGIFNTAVVYKDVLFQDQTISQFREVCGPKVEATRHLDKLTRRVCPQLDYFVTFSSISANRGNAGQTNYNFANAVMDSICSERRKIGEPATSIQWGVVGDVGIVAETSHGNDMVLLGSRAQRMHSCFEVMDMFLQGESPVCLSYVRADPESSRKEEGDTADILSVVARLLGLKDMTNMDPDITLGGLGVDSLIAVEIKQALDKSSGSSISIKDVRNLSIASLIQISSQHSSRSNSNASDTVADVPPVDVQPGK